MEGLLRLLTSQQAETDSRRDTPTHDATTSMLALTGFMGFKTSATNASEGRLSILKQHVFQLTGASPALSDKKNIDVAASITKQEAAKQKLAPTAPTPIPPPKAFSRQQATQEDAHASPPSPSTQSGATTASTLSYDCEVVVDRIRQLSLPSTSLEALVSEECRRFVSSQEDPSSGLPPTILVGDLASFLAKRFPSSRFFLRKVTDTKQYWTKSMTNTFIICISNAQPQQHVLIDPSFKSSFKVGGQATERYLSIYSALPEIFIGTSSTLSALLHIICFEAVKMFESQGKPTPPWRRYNNQIGRWHSNACEDTLVSPWAMMVGQSQSSALSQVGEPSGSSKKSSHNRVVKAGAMKQDFKLIQGFDIN